MIVKSNQHDYADLSVVLVRESKQVEPELIKHDVNYYGVDKEVAKQIAKNTGMKSLQFSKTLHKLDNEVWDKLLKNREHDYEYAKDYYTNARLVVAKGKVKALTWTSNGLEQYLNILDSYLKSPHPSYLITNTDENILRHIVMLSENSPHGVELRYNVSYNWVTIYKVHKVGDIYLTSHTLVEDHIVDEGSNIVIGYQTIMKMLLDEIELQIIEDIEVLKAKVKKPVSVSELDYYLRKFKIKLEEYMTDENLTLRVEEMGVYPKYRDMYVKFLTLVKSDERLLASYYSNWLVKTIDLTGITFYDLLKFANDIDVDREMIVAISGKVIDDEVDKDLLEQGKLVGVEVKR